MKTHVFVALPLLLATAVSFADELTPEQLFKSARIDCSDPSGVYQKGILEDDSAATKAYTQAVIKIKNGMATYYSGSFDETELDGIVKLKMTIQEHGLGGGNKKYSLGIGQGGTSVVFRDFSYGTEWIAECKVTEG